ncbi:MAG TPA: class I adenylate-forming enzyme family protein, partial [Terrimicrobiaceae bacterium]|nr:class I adenylate-forming enzyme family protein [Terrimicrobiaceae bacterium]
AVFAPDGTVLRTFSAIEEEANRWFDRLAGLTDSAPVSLQIGNRAEWPALLLAVWRSGRGLLPIEPEMAKDQRARVERLCGARVRIVWDGSELSAVSARGAQGSGHPAGDLFKLTSGTTAEPRAIRFSAAQLLADCDNVCDTMGLRESDRNYGIISFAHSYGFSNLITPLLCRGISLVAASDIIPRAIADGLEASSATVLPGVPAIFRSQAEFTAAGQQLRLCISAGAPLPSEVARRFFERWNLKIHSFYGASECGGICYDSSESPDPPSGYVGSPLEGVDLALGGEEPSTVLVRSGAVGAGYWPMVEESSFVKGAFRPSDLLVRHGSGYVIAGRVSDLINVAGRKVNPGEVERVLRMSPRVREAVVLGLPARARGEEVVACIEGDVNEADLRMLCARNLAAWQVPRRWFFFDEIPLNTRGKISRAELRARLIRD